jgi:uridylate kinase
MPSIVLSLGGSVLLPEIDKPFLNPYVQVLSKLSEKFRLFVVVGGGGTARRYIALAKNIGADDAFSDELGIQVTRLNAMLLMGALGTKAYPDISKDYIQALCAAETGKIVVMGGVIPGQTTDAVAAVLSERVKASLFVNLTAIDGIYSADPRIYPSARKFEFMTPSDLLKIIVSQQAIAGVNTVMDILAVKIIERSRIPLFVMDGRKPELLFNALEKGEYIGTVVTHDGKNSLPSFN